ncbi:MAG: hypothetical protein ACM3RX_06660 [Methanococcaceae archaeon]
MHDLEKNKLGMYETVISYLAENRDVVSSVRGFNYTINKLRKIIDEIKKKDKIISSETLEKSIIYAKAKDDLVFALVPHLTALFNYARTINDVTLKSKTALSISNLMRMLDKDLLRKSESTISLSEFYLRKLSKYRITSTGISDLKTKLGSFKYSLDQKVITCLSSESVLELEALFNKADEHMTQLDKMVELVNDEYEEFYDDYLNARDLENQDQSKALRELEEEEEE